MRRIIIALLFAGGAAGAGAQTQATIEDCYRWARANYLLVEQYELIERTVAYNLENAAKGWLPQVAFSAQASYQSDVTSLPFDPARLGFAGVEIPTLSRDQYGARIEVDQTVWDGGAVGARREGVCAAAELQRADTEVGLYALRERVNGLFFGILLTGERLERLALLEGELAVNLGRVEAYVRGGIAGQADVDAIKIEQLRTRQQRLALDATRHAYIEMLSGLTGRSLDRHTQFIKPSAGLPAGSEVRRPELELFDAQIRNIEARERSLNASVMPRVGLFATGGYGKPGLNMLANRFETYYIVGARVSWNIGGLYTRRNDRRQILSDVRGVELRRDAFMLNTGLDVSLKNSEIERCRGQLRYDDEIIALRESVLRSSEARMAGGTLSGSDLAREINALEAARQDKILHEMELLIAVFNLRYVTNN